jgi:4-oxalomesaconate tautomerase
MQTAIPCDVMRGGTSKGLYFRAEDLPADIPTRDRVLLAAMGSPDKRQIDGMGGADPLTSKVAVVGPPTRPDADVDYLFLQVLVDEARVDPNQNCGNILAGIGPYAVEHGLVAPRDGHTDIRIHMVNTGSLAIATVETPGGRVEYEGSARIDGVPGTAAPIMLDFRDIAGSSTGALLPTGNSRDVFEGIETTCIDNGMPVVLIRATDLGKRGDEPPAELEGDTALTKKVEEIRLAAGRAMNLGDVSRKNVPKMSLISAPAHGGTLNTRTFIPRKVHTSIGVLGAISVATACVLPGSVAAAFAPSRGGSGTRKLDIEHPTGFFTVELEVAPGNTFSVTRSALLRTARLLMRGDVMVPASVWRGPAPSTGSTP